MESERMRLIAMDILKSPPLPRRCQAPCINRQSDVTDENIRVSGLKFYVENQMYLDSVNQEQKDGIVNMEHHKKTRPNASGGQDYATQQQVAEIMRPEPHHHHQEIQDGAVGSESCPGLSFQKQLPESMELDENKQTEDEWGEGGEDVNKLMIAYADQIEQTEWAEGGEEMERLMNQCADKLESKINKTFLNESWRLLDETVYPLTRSGSKFLTVGVKPVSFLAVVRIANPQLTAAAWFTTEELSEFYALMKEEEAVIERGGRDTIVGRLRNYSIIVDNFNNVGFMSHRKNEVYKTLYLSKDTIKTLMRLEQHITHLILNREIKKKCYPDYKRFVSDVALCIRGGESINFEEAVFITLQSTEGNTYLYELALKIPATLKRDVNEVLAYFENHNDFNYL